MSKYIGTYFYHDVQDVGASYGNIFLPLEERNLIYWRTVYTLFFTSIIKNKHEKIKYVLFTNVTTFPLRKEIELLGVTVFDNLKLSYRNPGKWATVKFFFDVINFIQDDSYFNFGDSIILLDTDCIALNNSADLFSYVENVNRPVVYITDRFESGDQYFHGLPISTLENLVKKYFSRDVRLKNAIGGEFFAFNKNEEFGRFRYQYERLLRAPQCHLLTTEEQILTMVNADKEFMNFELSIYRIWTTYRNYDVPNDFSKFTFLHLPSEKIYGLNRLFDRLVGLAPSSLTNDTLDEIIYKLLPINNRFKLYAMRVREDFKFFAFGHRGSY